MSRSIPPLSRRAALAGVAALSGVLALPALAAPRATLALHGPPGGPSITLAHAAATGALRELAEAVTLTVWRNPDELRAGLTSGAIELSVVPVQAAANLYNRGMGIRLVNTMTDGLYSIVGPDGAARDMAGLAGRKLALPFVNDTPDFVLRALLAHHGLAEAVEIVPVGSPVEAAQLLLAGRIELALLSEPAASVAIIRGRDAGRPLARVIDVQAEWGGLTGLGPIVPQAGLAVTSAFLEASPGLIGPLQDRLARVTDAVKADPAAAAANASAALELPAPVLATSIPHCNLVARPASTVRAEIEAMLTLMAKADAAIIGGKLPDAGFYAL